MTRAMARRAGTPPARTFFLSIVAALFLAAMPLSAISLKDKVIGSQHDLTAGGTGPVRSVSTAACVFCHAPHTNIQTIGGVPTAVTPLWDHTLSTQTYTAYSSSTYTPSAQTPGAGSSKLCLSCHDGTVASGMTVAGLITTTGAMTSADNLTTNLSNSHPVGMTPVSGSKYASLVKALFASPPTTNDPAVQLVNGRIECVTCHDPHVPNNDPALPMFLVRTNSGSTICLACHDPSQALPNALNGWAAGSHATATNTVPTTAAFGAYGTVAADGCSNCHNAHNNPSAPRSLKGVESAACSPCHAGTNASPALRNVMGEYAKAYSHPTLTVTGVHDPVETLPLSNTRHAACADCHNSHAAYAQTGTAVAPAVPAAMAVVSGWDTTGSQLPAAKEYQVCYKCHADSTNKPTATTVYGRMPIRYPGGPVPTGPTIQPPAPADQYNLRLKFASTIGHNVAGNSIVTTTNTNLRPYMLNIDLATNNVNRPLSTTTILYCTDCHNNDQARSSNGTGPNGPHGSAFPHLLQFNLFQSPAGGGGGGGGGGTGASLCNKCHTVANLSGTEHASEHVGSGCTTCHDPHGVIGGTPAANRAMLNFDTAVALKATSGWGFYYISAASKGCYTNCHGESHNPRSY